MNRNLLFATIGSGLGSGFQHGYHGGVINTPELVLRAWILQAYQHRNNVTLSDQALTGVWSATVSIMNLGGTIGGLCCGAVAMRFGPKTGLFLNNIFVVIATFLMALSKTAGSPEMIIVGRLVIGVNCGLNAGLCPMYLSEIAPVKLRGGIASVYQLVIVISILLSMIFGLDVILGHPQRWPFLFVIPALFMIIQVAMLPFSVESPRFLVGRKEDGDEKARKALVWLRRDEDVGLEMAEIKAADDNVKATPKVTLGDMFRKKSLRTPLFISLGMMVAQQFSGINAVIFYSTGTFMKAGIAPEYCPYATIGLGGVNLIMTILSMIMVEVAGRKTLLLIGFGGMAIDTLAMAIVIVLKDRAEWLPYLTIVFMVIYIILFAAGAGSIPWFIVTEIFNQDARPKAVSMAVPTNWIANLIVTLAFPSIEGAIDGYVFLIFAGLNTLFFVFILFCVPETKNKTIQEITSQFKD